MVITFIKIMSLSLAKKSLRLLEQMEDDPSKKVKQNKKIKTIKKEQNSKEEKIQKLLLLNQSSLDKKLAKKVNIAITNKFLIF